MSGQAAEKGALWDEVMKALSRLRQCELTEVESEAVHACQVATGNVVIEQESPALSSSGDSNG